MSAIENHLGGSDAIVAAGRQESPPIRHGRERRLAEVAGRQHGVVARSQLLALGFSSSAVQRALVQGRLHRVHHGVYAVGHSALDPRGRRLAAVLACGPGAVLSHRSAAALWEIRATSRGRIEVTRCVAVSAPAGVDLRRTARLSACEVTVREGIPVTTPARTLADLAAVLRRRDLERALERAQTLQLLDAPALLRSAHSRPGAPEIRRILAAWATPRTKSELEVALLALVQRSSLPAPEVNAHVGGFEVDLLWRAARVVAEADSLQFHLSRAAMERDRDRDASLAAAGYRVQRFTDRQVRRQPEQVIAALQGAMRDRS